MVDRESINPEANKYIEKIESRLNRKARLAHEIGAGAPCLKCGDKCSGFELHYWRKVCLNCRCGKDDHDIQDDEDIGHFIIGKLFDRPDPRRAGGSGTLGSPTKDSVVAGPDHLKKKKKGAATTTLELPSSLSAALAPHQFEWVPPNVAPELAARYMTALPPERRPIAGSQAAKDRKQLLGQQIPLYDMDETRRCEAMPQEELQQFQAHLEHVRSNVVGQGIVSEIQLAPKLLVGRLSGTGQMEDAGSTGGTGIAGGAGSTAVAASHQPLVGGKGPNFHVRDNTRLSRESGSSSSSLDQQRSPSRTSVAGPPPFFPPAGTNTYNNNNNNNGESMQGPPPLPAGPPPYGDDSPQWPAPPPPLLTDEERRRQQRDPNANVNALNNSYNSGGGVGRDANRSSFIGDMLSSGGSGGSAGPDQLTGGMAGLRVGAADPNSNLPWTQREPGPGYGPSSGGVLVGPSAQSGVSPAGPGNHAGLTGSSLTHSASPNQYLASSAASQRAGSQGPLLSGGGGGILGAATLPRPYGSVGSNPSLSGAGVQGPYHHQQHSELYPEQQQQQGSGGSLNSLMSPTPYGGPAGPVSQVHPRMDPLTGSPRPSSTTGINTGAGASYDPRGPPYGAPSATTGGQPAISSSLDDLANQIGSAGPTPFASMDPHQQQQQMAQAEQYRDRLAGPQLQSSSSDVSVLFPGESAPLYAQLRGKSAGGDGEAVMQQQQASRHDCQQCSQPMMPGEVAVICERAGPQKFWHPGCFVCHECNDLLADMIYFWHEGRVYCGRHYHQAASVPRCHACDELIFSDSWTRAEGLDWHLSHFTCFLCDTALAGQSYVPADSGQPYCLPCHMAAQAQTCETCELKIEPGCKQCQYRDYHYHATDDCFSCHACRAPLLGGKFKMIKNWLFCSADCVNSCATDIERNPATKFKHGETEKKQ